MNKYTTLLQQVKLIYNSNELMRHKYFCNEPYVRKCKPRFKCDNADSIADSIYTLFGTHNSQYLTRLLLILGLQNY